MIPILPPEQLLDTPHRKKQLAIIRDVTSLPAAHFQSCYQGLFQRLAALVQQLPASEYHHHAHSGGLLDHCLEVAAHAGSLRRGYTLPTGADPEVVRRSSEIWTFAAVAGAALHDIGKLISDQHIEVRGPHDREFSLWHPWMGPLHQPQVLAKRWTAWLRQPASRLRWTEYRMRFRPDRQYRHHEASALVLLPLLMDAVSLTWLNQFPDAFNAFIAYLSGHKDRSELSVIITDADRASVAKALGGTRDRALQVTTTALQSLHDKLIHALRYLVTEGKLPINRPGAAVWVQGADVWLVSKTCMDAARAQMMSQGMSGVPTKNSVLFDELQDHQSLIPCGQGARNAIWTARVQCGSWSQELTLIRLRSPLLWPNGVPELPEIHVYPQLTEPESSPETAAPAPQPAPMEPVEPVPVMAAPAISMANPASPEPRLDPTPLAVEGESDPFAFLNAPTAPAVIPLTSPTPADPVDDDDPFAFLTAATPVPAPQPSPTDAPKAAPLPVNRPHNPPAPAIAPAIKPAPAAQPAVTAAPSLLQVETLLVDWLREGLSSGRLRMNEPKAKIHLVAGGLFLVTPGIFQEFMKRTPIAAELLNRDPQLKPEYRADLWKAVQKRFESLGWHVRSNELNIHTASVKGAQKESTLRGYFIADRTLLLTANPHTLFDNPHITLLHGDEP